MLPVLSPSKTSRPKGMGLEVMKPVAGIALSSRGAESRCSACDRRSSWLVVSTHEGCGLDLALATTGEGDSSGGEHARGCGLGSALNQGEPG